MKQCRGLWKQSFSVLAVFLLLIVGLVPMATSDTPSGNPFYIYGYIEDEYGPVAGAIVNLSLSSNGTVVEWNETTTDADGFYSILFQGALVDDVVVGRVAGVRDTLLVDDGPGGWLNMSYVHLEYTLSPGWNLISMGLITSTLASNITSQTSTCLFIVNWSATAKTYTQTYARDSSEDDFTLVDGYGYWAYAETTEHFNITGIEKTGPKTYALAPGGWNLIGWTDTTSTTASGLCNIVNDTYYEGVRGYITPWNNSLQEYDNGYLESPLFPPGAFPNIAITRGRGYWMWVSSATNWTHEPEAAMGWSDEMILTDPEDIYRHTAPRISAYDDYVHVVFQTRWGSAPFITEQIQYMRSSDGGLTWEERRNVSVPIRVAAPNVASYQNHVYVVWTDDHEVDGGPEIYMNISHDYGETWTGAFNVSAMNDRRADWASVDAEEERVVVAWGDERYRPGAPTVYIRISEDNGATWGEEKLLTDLELIDDDYSEVPYQVVLRGQNIYLLFSRWIPSTGRGETMFMKSTDLGETWTTPTMLSHMDEWNSFPCSMAVDGDRIYVVWNNATPEDEIYMRRSLDGGGTWLPEQRMTNDPNTTGTGMVAVGNAGKVYLSFGDNRSGSPEVWFKQSNDYGETWEPEYKLTTGEPYSGGGRLTYSQNKLHLAYISDRTSRPEVFYMRKPQW